MAHAHAHPHDEWCRPLPLTKGLPAHASLGAAQVLLDRERLAHRPELLARKWRRMGESPFAFLRGAALLFDECLRREGSFAAGPSGGGSLIGDCHLENFGVFITHAHEPVFHVNDFDALRDGPWRFDVLRLLTSFLLARPELRLSGPAVHGLMHEALDGHQAGLAGVRTSPPAWVRQLLGEARVAPLEKLLKKHLEGRLLIRDEKHPPAPPALVKQLPGVLAQWAATVKGAGIGQGQLELLDVRRRIIGTGSLGTERLIALVRGDSRRDSPHGLWLLDIKEVDFSAARIVEAIRGSVRRPPAMLGYAALGKLEVIIRRLCPGEEKLALEKVEPSQALAVARYLGTLTGEAHRRLARTRPRRWTPKELAGLLASAGRLAALHEEAFIQFCAASG